VSINVSKQRRVFCHCIIIVFRLESLRKSGSDTIEDNATRYLENPGANVVTFAESFSVDFRLGILRVKSLY
jgi:hypothetical protein